MKGTKYGKFATFRTFLQQLFILIIIEDIMRQTKKRETIPTTQAPRISPDEQRKIDIKGRSNSAIALISENITATIDAVKVMKQQAAAYKAAQAALAMRMANADKATQYLLLNMNIMQQNLASVVSCRDTDTEFSEKGIVPTIMVCDDHIGGAADAKSGLPSNARFRRVTGFTKLARVERGEGF